MGLEVHLIEDGSDRSIADGGDDPLFHRLAGQILARPVGDMQALSNWLQTSERDDLGALEGGKSGPGGPVAGAVPTVRPVRARGSGGTCGGWFRRRTASGKPRHRCVALARSRGQSEPGGLDTKAATRCERSTPARFDHGMGWSRETVFDHACDDPRCWRDWVFQHSRFVEFPTLFSSGPTRIPPG